MTSPKTRPTAGVSICGSYKREAAGGHLEKPPLLGLSFGGRQRRAVMDTGSTGIVVAASSIPDVDRLESRGPGTLTYTSSGRIMRGDWVVTPVTIAGANGASVTTAPIPVLAVRRIECLDNARNCTAEREPASRRNDRHRVRAQGSGPAGATKIRSSIWPTEGPVKSAPVAAMW